MAKCIALVMFDNNYCIGMNNNQPIHLMLDLKRFMEKTQNSVVIYGSKTLSTFPNSAPLKNRTNIILSSSNILKERYGDMVVSDINSLVHKVEEYLRRGINVYIIGGAMVYEELMFLVDEIHATKVNTDFLKLVPGGKATYFPYIRLNREYICKYITDIKDIDKLTGDGYDTQELIYICK